MITDALLAQLCAAIYDGPAGFDLFETGTNSDGVCYGIKRTEGVDIVVLRGSVTLQDWLRDFNAWGRVVECRLGPVHPGFAAGMEMTWLRLQGQIGQRSIITGHSLGAARAAILTGLMTLDNRAPLARVVMGEPKAGFAQLADIVRKSPGRSYSNGANGKHDLVVDVPFTFPPEEYVRPSELIRVSAAPTGAILSRLGVFALHHIPLYAAGIAALPQESSI
jgi:lipase (class 3)